MTHFSLSLREGTCYGSQKEAPFKGSQPLQCDSAYDNIQQLFAVLDYSTALRYAPQYIQFCQSKRSTRSVCSCQQTKSTMIHSNQTLEDSSIALGSDSNENRAAVRLVSIRREPRDRIRDRSQRPNRQVRLLGLDGLPTPFHRPETVAVLHLHAASNGKTISKWSSSLLKLLKHAPS